VTGYELTPIPHPTIVNIGSSVLKIMPKGKKKRTENKGDNTSLPPSKCCQRAVAVEALLMMQVWVLYGDALTSSPRTALHGLNDWECDELVRRRTSGGNLDARTWCSDD
jgi:hypothetical protein